MQQKKFTREVVLLSKLNQVFTVRGSWKADLVRKGQVIQCFDFIREWSEEEVYEHLNGAFADVLHGTREVIPMCYYNVDSLQDLPYETEK